MMFRRIIIMQHDIQHVLFEIAQLCGDCCSIMTAGVQFVQIIYYFMIICVNNKLN